MRCFCRNVAAISGFQKAAVKSAFAKSRVCALQWFGKLAIVIVPVLIALTVLVGLFAAATYNTGADQILKPCALRR